MRRRRRESSYLSSHLLDESRVAAAPAPRRRPRRRACARRARRGPSPRESRRARALTEYARVEEEDCSRPAAHGATHYVHMAAAAPFRARPSSVGSCRMARPEICLSWRGVRGRQVLPALYRSSFIAASLPLGGRRPPRRGEAVGPGVQARARRQRQTRFFACRRRLRPRLFVVVLPAHCIILMAGPHEEKTTLLGEGVPPAVGGGWSEFADRAATCRRVRQVHVQGERRRRLVD